MQTQKKKHSKFKNGGMLFELLTRQITSDILAGRDESFTKNLLFKYFNESTELGKEVQLYNFIVNQSLKDIKSADRLLEIIIHTRTKLNEKELHRQKYNLIREIKGKYEINEFLKNKIPNYKLYASVYKIFENAINDTITFSVKELMESKDCVIEALTKQKNVSKEELNMYSSQSSDVKLMAYKFLIENFNKKYSSLLPRQKSLLKEYINNYTNTSKFKKYFNLELDIVTEEINSLTKKINCEIIRIKLNETTNQLSNKKTVKVIKDSHLNALMNSYELIEELQSLKDTQLK